MKPEEKIYYAFYATKKEWLYFNELKLHTKMSNSSLQNALNKLISNKELQERKETSNIFYKLADKNKIMLNFSVFDLERLEKLNLNVRIPLKDFLNQIPKQIEFILLFGSSSRKEEKKESDIDLLIVLNKFLDEKLQKLYESEIKKEFEGVRKAVNVRSTHPLSLAFVNSEEFKTSKDHLLIQAKNTGFPIFGNLEYHKNE